MSAMMYVKHNEVERRYLMREGEIIPVELLSPTFDPSYPSYCRCKGCSPFISASSVHERPRSHVLGDHVSAGAPPMGISMLKQPAQSLTRGCSGCRQPGHNIRTCSARRPA